MTKDELIEYYKLTEDLKKALEDKEKEIRQAKEVAVLSIMTLMPFYQSLESRTMMALTMPSVK